MSILFIDSAAHYAAADAYQKSVFICNNTYAVVEIDPTASVSGKPIYKLSNAGNHYNQAAYVSLFGMGNEPETVIGARFKFGSLTTYASGTPIMSFYSVNGWCNCIIAVTKGGGIAAYRPPWNGSLGWDGMASGSVLMSMGTLLASSTSAPIVPGNWYYIECRCRFGDTWDGHDMPIDGQVQVWVNGGLVMDTGYPVQVNVIHMLPNLGGFSDGLIGAISFGAVIGRGTSSYVGEFHRSTEAQGDIRIDAHFPDANGTDSDWTRSEGADDYALLDEHVANVTDYLYTDTIGAMVSVSLEPLWNVGGIILTVQMVVYLTKANAGPCEVKPFVRIGGVKYQNPASGWFPSWGSWQLFRQNFPTNPATGVAWLESEFNAAEFGVERTEWP